jgi:hypothetical protein
VGLLVLSRLRQYAASYSSTAWLMALPQQQQQQQQQTHPHM